MPIEITQQWKDLVVCVECMLNIIKYLLFCLGNCHILAFTGAQHTPFLVCALFFLDLCVWVVSTWMCAVWNWHQCQNRQCHIFDLRFSLVKQTEIFSHLMLSENSTTWMIRWMFTIPSSLCTRTSIRIWFDLFCECRNLYFDCENIHMRRLNTYKK